MLNAGGVLVTGYLPYRYLTFSRHPCACKRLTQPLYTLSTAIMDIARSASSPGAEAPPAHSPHMDEVVHAHGHDHVRAEHASTWELTSDDWLTPAGDCILGIEADPVPADFDPAFVAACQDRTATLEATLRVAGHEQVIVGSGHPDLTFDNERSLVVRTSDYVDDRTVMVNADTAAAEIDRELVAALADGAALTCTLRVR